MRRLIWLVALGVTATAGCSAASPAPTVTATCDPLRTDPSAHSPAAATTAGCTSVEFTAADTYTLTFTTPGWDAAIDYTLVGAGGGGAEAPGPVVVARGWGPAAPAGAAAGVGVQAPRSPPPGHRCPPAPPPSGSRSSWARGAVAVWGVAGPPCPAPRDTTEHQPPSAVTAWC
ncbi:MAG TPA: hypothetical protein VE673_13570 [Pseudonocardiaceae bacterium]|nr:hypothetical protein [Pseudonocardiaceae bacterium]